MEGKKTMDVECIGWTSVGVDSASPTDYGGKLFQCHVTVLQDQRCEPYGITSSIGLMWTKPTVA